ncbi:hypothetical protein FH972_013590 [Carpinus fangiana]|uniref:Uncharacterized protein n=1 Tax=Carpinus fangiana TaxID=176857 RepID=A0A5N6RAE2_9ROSI|nr:hypothetical protein FH972_013590 [Carpinus fangiana]
MKNHRGRDVVIIKKNPFKSGWSKNGFEPTDNFPVSRVSYIDGNFAGWSSIGLSWPNFGNRGLASPEILLAEG